MRPREKINNQVHYHMADSRYLRYCIYIDFLGILLLYPPYPKDRGMLWFYVEAARRPPPAARNGVNAITQKPRDGLFSNLVYTLLVIVSWPD